GAQALAIGDLNGDGWPDLAVPLTKLNTVALLFNTTNANPDCSGAMAVAPEIWPPNHELALISIVGVTDADGDPVTITATGITQDEPLNGQGDGDTCPDGVLENGVARVRMERGG